jgi:hypothetical protein
MAAGLQVGKIRRLEGLTTRQKTATPIARLRFYTVTGDAATPKRRAASRLRFAVAEVSKCLDVAARCDGCIQGPCDGRCGGEGVQSSESTECVS